MTRNFNMAPGSSWRDVEGPDDAAEAAERHFERLDARVRERRDDAPPKRTLYVCELSNGQFVGNLISGPDIRSFVRVDQERDACHFYFPSDARHAATEHGAEDFTVRPSNFPEIYRGCLGGTKADRKHAEQERAFNEGIREGIERRMR